MMDTRAVSEELQEMQRRMTTRIRKRQEMVTGTIRTWTQAAQSIRPQLPGTEALTRLPKPQDLADRLPRPEHLVAGAQEIAGQLIASQRRLAGQVLSTAMPLARQGAAVLAHRIPGRSPAPARDAMPTLTAQQATEPETATEPEITAAKPAGGKSTGSKPAAAKTAGAKATGRGSGAQRGTGDSKPRSAAKEK